MGVEGVEEGVEEEGLAGHVHLDYFVAVVAVVFPLSVAVVPLDRTESDGTKGNTEGNSRSV